MKYCTALCLTWGGKAKDECLVHEGGGWTREDLIDLPSTQKSIIQTERKKANEKIEKRYPILNNEVEITHTIKEMTRRTWFIQKNEVRIQMVKPYVMEGEDRDQEADHNNQSREEEEREVNHLRGRIEG